jgi:hypothetical protein
MWKWAEVQVLLSQAEGQKMSREGQPCHCGSGEPCTMLYDAKGIPVSYVCDKCEKRTRAKYRPEIFEDSQYDTYGEQVEEDY